MVDQNYETDPSNDPEKMNLAVSSFRLQNFKSIRDSGKICFTPLTVFIGNNGVGKSSLIEGMETIQSIADDGLDKAMQRWLGFDYIRHMGASHAVRKTREGRKFQAGSMAFEIEGTAREGHGENIKSRTFRASSEITVDPDTNELSFLKENLIQQWPTTKQGEKGTPELRKRTVTRSTSGVVMDQTEGFNPQLQPLSPNESVLYAETALRVWQFVRLNPEAMMAPRPLRQVGGFLRLETDGANIAEYLWNINQQFPRQFPTVMNGIIETIQFVMPYVQDVRPVITSEIGRNAHLQLSERKMKIPGWLFSTGTIRLVALLALLRHPEPPPLIVIEELENGLDPRTLGLIVEEIRNVVSTGRSQIIATTHSPYLLDLLPLSSLIFVERRDGQPVFTRPADDESTLRWSQEFAPGRLYTMGRFRK